MIKPIFPDIRYHFAGIGGIGMSALAHIMCDLGYSVSGSEPTITPLVEQLIQKKVRVVNEDQFPPMDLAILTSAIGEQHPIRQYLQKNRIPMIIRGQFLAQIVQNEPVIAICGSHGKTTTSALIGEMLVFAGLDPTIILGGLSQANQKNYRLGKGSTVLEADESDGSFLHLHPQFCVITNIDNDHLNNYNNSFEDLVQAFKNFAQKPPFYGATITEKSVATLLNIPAITFAIHQAADFWADEIRITPTATHFTLHYKDAALPAQLNAFGEHNVLNALAAIATCYMQGVPLTTCVQALANFGGVKRRMEFHASTRVNGHDVLVYEDYGHHPEEIRQSLRTLKSMYPQKKLMCVFEPHRHTRSESLFSDFCQVLQLADLSVIAPIYAAGEEPGALTNHSFVHQMVSEGADAVAHNSLQTIEDLAPHIQGNTVIVLQGAGPLAATLTRAFA